MIIKISCVNANHMVVSNPKKVKFWKNLIDQGALKLCKYKVVK
jgi:hypothetical protein